MNGKSRIGILLLLLISMLLSSRVCSQEVAKVKLKTVELLNPEDEVKQSFKKSELKRIEKNIKKIIQKFVPKDTKSATVYVMTLLPTGELREFEVAASTQISAETVQKLFDAINEIEVPKSRAHTIRYNLLFQVN